MDNNINQPASPTMKAVLVIEDDPDIREAVEDILEIGQISAVTKGTGVEGVETFLANPDDFGVVLVDYSLPTMTGKDVIAELRKVRPHVKIVVSSGHSKDTILRLLDTESQYVTDFLPKPYDLFNLIEKMKTVLGSAVTELT